MQNTQELKDEIRALAKAKNAVILAHFYTLPEIQEIADFVGDSYQLARLAVDDSRQVVVFCGVSFMGESACILNPAKTVLLPCFDAVCPMAEMVSAGQIAAARAKYDDLAVVCYINSTAKIKALCDVCVTSSNALKIVRNLPNKNIFFVPDEHLGSFIKASVKEKNIILAEGFCEVHAAITADAVGNAKKSHPNAKVIAHPECKKEVVALSDFVGSTKGLIDFAKNDEASEFIVCTERGIEHALRIAAPRKAFYFPLENQICENMKKITLESVRDCLLKFEPVEVAPNLATAALAPLAKMLELSK